jgi:hypothetical protein
MAQRRSSLIYNVSLIIGLTYVSGCSLKDTKYLSEGKPAGKGGNNNRGGNAGDSGVGGDAGAGANAGGSSGSGNSGGEPSTTTTAPECSAGKTKCDGVAECVSLSSGTASGATYDHCGTCTNTCNLTNAVSAACDTGACKPLCNAGYKDCNVTTANDGCEVDITTVIACGDCERACSKTGVLNAVCTAGKCVPICKPKSADCNLDVGSGTDDGCETELNALTRCGKTCTDGVACSPTQVCNTGVCGAAQGVVQLSIPFTEAGQTMRYADKFPSLPNLIDGTMTIRMYAPGVTSGSFQAYVNDGDYTSGTGSIMQLSLLNSGWVDVKVPIGHGGGAFDPTQITQLTIEITSTVPGTTNVYIDSIWSSNWLVDDTFDSALGQFVKSSLLTVTGATSTWMDAVPAT